MTKHIQIALWVGCHRRRVRDECGRVVGGPIGPAIGTDLMTQVAVVIAGWRAGYRLIWADMDSMYLSIRGQQETRPLVDTVLIVAKGIAVDYATSRPPSAVAPHAHPNRTDRVLCGACVG